MPPCLGSSAVAAVKEAATISSDVATTDPCARRIANPPYSSAALPHFFCVQPWTDFSIHNSRPPIGVSGSMTKTPRQQAATLSPGQETSSQIPPMARSFDASCRRSHQDQNRSAHHARGLTNGNMSGRLPIATKLMRRSVLFNLHPPPMPHPCQLTPPAPSACPWRNRKRSQPPDFTTGRHLPVVSYCGATVNDHATECPRELRCPPSRASMKIARHEWISRRLRQPRSPLWGSSTAT